MKAVILIHGFITSPEDFNPLYKFLNKNYDYVCKVYLPGHKDDENYKSFTFDSTLNVILNTYDDIALKYDTIDLIGFSLGGALASFLASVRNIRKLVLLSPANKYLRFGFFLKYKKNQTMYKKRYKALKRKNDPRALSYLNKIQSMKTNNKRSIKMAIFDLFPHYTLHTLKVFSRLISYVNKNLNTIKSDTLICWGELDQLVPYKSIEFLSNYIKNPKIIVYKDISHLMLGSTNIEMLVFNIESFLSK